jgi:hypothetical protein
MISLRVRPVDNKHIRISGIHPYLAELLCELPEILGQRDSPAARARLFPKPSSDDPKLNEDWQQIVGPELRHLFVSAGEIVARDLTGLQPETPATGTLRVTFPAEHINAWMSALNQARLILGELHGVTEEDMNTGLVELRTPKQHAVLRIHLLGYLLQLFVELESGEAPGEPSGSARQPFGDGG